MAKKKTQNKKLNIAAILGMILLVLVLVCVVIYITINHSNKITIYSNDDIKLYTVEYEEGMTWEEWVNSEYNSLKYSTIILKIDEYGNYLYYSDGMKMILYDCDNGWDSDLCSEIINPSSNYLFSI